MEGGDSMFQLHVKAVFTDRNEVWVNWTVSRETWVCGVIEGVICVMVILNSRLIKVVM